MHRKRERESNSRSLKKITLPFADWQTRLKAHEGILPLLSTSVSDLNFTIDFIFDVYPLTYIVDRAAQQQLASKEAAAQKSREEYSRTIKELKLRQGMGAGSFDPAHVHEERLPGAHPSDQDANQPNQPTDQPKQQQQPTHKMMRHKAAFESFYHNNNSYVYT